MPNPSKVFGRDRKTTDAGASANTVTVTEKSTPAAIVGVVVPAKITNKMSIPEAVAVMTPAAAAYRGAIGSIMESGATAHRLEVEVLIPGLKKFRSWCYDTPLPERKKIMPGCYNMTKLLKALKLSDSILRMREHREKHKALGTELNQLMLAIDRDTHTQNDDKQPDTLPGNRQDDNGGSKGVPGDLTPEGRKLAEQTQREQVTAELLRQQQEAKTALAEAFASGTESDVDAASAALDTATQSVAEDAADVSEPESNESGVLTPASNAAPLPPLPGAIFTREQADADATMRQATELVGKHVWLARSADAFVLVLAFDKNIAEEIAKLNGVEPVSCINVNVAETAVIMQGVLDESRGFRFSMMKKPSEVEKTIETEMSKSAAQLSKQTDAKKPVQSETTADELVEVG